MDGGVIHSSTPASVFPDIYVFMPRLLRYLLLSLIVLLTACRGEEEEIVPIEMGQVQAAQPHAKMGAMVVVNEGNMGSNKATIDYLDYRTGRYHRNIYGALNPGVVMALGDVGNDVLVHGSRLYVVVNASGLIEVMQAGSGKHIGTITLPNGRYLTAHKDKVYATSFASPIGFSPTEQRGEVVEIDTLTLAITRRCTVGEQPEGVARVGNHLLVANSGGYRAPHYSSTVSVVHLGTFREERTIDVALNPQHILATSEGKVYVSARGNYADIPPSVHHLDTNNWSVSPALGFVATSWWLDDDKIYALGAAYDKSKNQYQRSLVCYDTYSETLCAVNGKNEIRSANVPARTAENETHNAENTIPTLVDAAPFEAIRMPYGIAVNPESKDIYIADAGNFTSPGTLHCFSPTGRHRWQVLTGDIPGHFAFIPAHLGAPDFSEHPAPSHSGSPYLTRVLSYRPAPGQFTNKMPLATASDTEATMCQKVLEAIGHNRQGLVGLGAWGGSLVVGFDHRISNRPDATDFHIDGNAFDGSSEAGLVEVAVDRNRNGLPDENEWYRLVAPNTLSLLTPYDLTYTAPEDVATMDVPWRDTQGGSGNITRNQWNTQPYYPLWVKEKKLRFQSWRLPNTAENRGTPSAPLWYLQRSEGAWADNTAGGDDFDIAWAVDAQGKAVPLDGIDFVRITTALHQSAGWLGETSTEVSNVYERFRPAK